MLPPLFLSVRMPTLLASFWRSHIAENPGSEVSRHGRVSIILFRLDALGDVVMTTPLFRELKHVFPKSHFTVVVQNAFRPLLLASPHIDEILTPPDVKAAWLPRRARKLLSALLLYWKCLRRRRFDIAISPRWDVDEYLATMLCLLVNATQRVGYTEKASSMKRRLNRGFDAAFSICLPAGPVRHEVVRNLMVLEALGGTVQDSRLEVWLTERDREAAMRLLATVPLTTKLIALGIGAKSAGRRWPLQRYAECFNLLAQQVAARPVVVCSAREREAAMGLANLLHCPPIILSGAPLREACAVLEHCDLFLGNDSGTAHLAAAVDCKTVVISRHPQGGNPGHDNSPLRFGPYCKTARVLQPATGLEGCTESCQVLKPHCILAVSVDQAVAAARAMLLGAPPDVQTKRGKRHVFSNSEIASFLNCHHERDSAREGSAFAE